MEFRSPVRGKSGVREFANGSAQGRNGIAMDVKALSDGSLSFAGGVSGDNVTFLGFGESALCGTLCRHESKYSVRVKGSVRPGFRVEQSAGREDRVILA